ncbi:ComEC/Rec2 family competence protein [Chryseolinea lacunae]|uniref:ComEC family competence protein n=1 Tax=Chryseolinea lacunae TaxID=2801331 RepID=A0ABS1KKF2_9BACT|nr:ComEC/Rec2 family competence protein [Chryseolinea lacunae]MBL0739930.1 ComEC family competence protein [Chryseolinea lacunae]
MIRWIPYAFVRIVVFFCGGILLAIHRPDAMEWSVATSLFAACTALYLIFGGAYRTLQINPGFVGLAAIFFAGYLATVSHTASRHADHLLKLETPVAYYQAVVSTAPEEKDKSWKMVGDVVRVNTQGAWQAREGKVMLYFSKQDFKEPFQYGDVLLIRGTPQVVSPPGNPGEFDYQKFLSYRQIYHQQFVRGKHAALRVDYAPPSVIMRHAIAVRQWADGTLKKYVPGLRERTLASALVLGVTEGLDNELLQAYAATGALHVLSVSGLHVGIVYWLLLLLLRPLQKTARGKWVLAVVSIVVLWGYAFVTGLSPSVLRAVAMFSFMALAKPWNRQTNMYNTLAASAFCLLLYDPFMIMSVGFQLSYLAVAGIVYLHPPLYALWEPRARVVDEVWKVSSVSIAAQGATFALGLLYFHQFPNYFLVANLVAIPASFGVLVLGLVVLAVGAVPVIANFLGMVLGWIVKIMNAFVFGVENLPLSRIENIYITPAQFYLLALVLLCLVLLLETKQLRWLGVAVCAATFFSVLQFEYIRNEVEQHTFTVYKTPGFSAVDFVDEGQVFFWGDSALANDAGKIRFHIAPNRIRAGAAVHASQATRANVGEGCEVMVWQGKTILRIFARGFKLSPGLAVDYIMISRNAVRDLQELRAIHACQIILDGSNSFYTSEKLRTQAGRLKLPLHAVLHDGAFALPAVNL